jgi:CDP-diacylglycerol--serine O-phosphatidyltransferase
MVRWMKRIGAADLATLANGLLGTLAITYILDGEHVIASLLILVAVVLDGVDGFIARRFGSPHAFGQFLDSISDGVSFCLAPGLLIYNNYYDKALGSAWVSMMNAFAVVVCMAYVIFGVLRLSRFATKHYKSEHFLGLPAPAAAIIVVTTCMLWGQERLSPFAISYSLYPVLIFLLCIASIMIIDIPYPRLKKKGLIGAGVALVFAFLPLMHHLAIDNSKALPATELVFLSLLMAMLYVLIGPIYVKTLSLKGK